MIKWLRNKMAGKVGRWVIESLRSGKGWEYVAETSSHYGYVCHEESGIHFNRVGHFFGFNCIGHVFGKIELIILFYAVNSFIDNKVSDTLSGVNQYGKKNKRRR